jgi:hypothetical protein
MILFITARVYAVFAMCQRYQPNVSIQNLPHAYLHMKFSPYISSQSTAYLLDKFQLSKISRGSEFAKSLLAALDLDCKQRRHVVR